MNTIPQRPIVEAIHCRWKHLRGLGPEALYRASCGQPRCPGHLGDLHFVAEIEDQPEFLANLPRRWKEHHERAIVRGESWANELVKIAAEDRRKDLAVLQAEAEEMRRAAGGGETDLMGLAGWRSRSMVGRYGDSAASEHAREAHKRQSPGNRL